MKTAYLVGGGIAAAGLGYLLLKPSTPAASSPSTAPSATPPPAGATVPTAQGPIVTGPPSQSTTSIPFMAAAPGLPFTAPQASGVLVQGGGLSVSGKPAVVFGKRGLAPLVAPVGYSSGPAEGGACDPNYDELRAAGWFYWGDPPPFYCGADGVFYGRLDGKPFDFVKWFLSWNPETGWYRTLGQPGSVALNYDGSVAQVFAADGAWGKTPHWDVSPPQFADGDGFGMYDWVEANVPGRVPVGFEAAMMNNGHQYLVNARGLVPAWAATLAGGLNAANSAIGSMLLEAFAAAVGIDTSAIASGVATAVGVGASLL